MKYSILSQINYIVHICESFPQICPICKLLLTEYLDLFNIKIQRTHLNHVPVGLLLLPQEVPLGLNDHGTRQHQNKQICQKDNKNVKTSDKTCHHTGYTYIQPLKYQERSRSHNSGNCLEFIGFIVEIYNSRS